VVVINPSNGKKDKPDPKFPDLPGFPPTGNGPGRPRR